MCLNNWSQLSTFTAKLTYMAKIYVASSWRNPYQPEVVKKLREQGHEEKTILIITDYEKRIY